MESTIKHIFFILLVSTLVTSFTFAQQPAPATQTAPATQPTTQSTNYDEALDRLVKKLEHDAMWRNGRIPDIPLPASAKPEEVIASAVKSQPFRDGVKTYQILKIREFKVDHQIIAIRAALIQTDAGARILVFFPFGNIGWWTRFYDTDFGS